MTTALSTGSNAPTGFGLLLTPETIEQAKEFAKTLANSGLVPEKYAGKPDAILIAGAMGHRLGLDIFSALAGIAVVNGRPTLWGDAQLAVCQARQDWGGMTVEWKDEGDLTCIVTVLRKGLAPTVSSFSWSDAKTAGLSTKVGPWTQYPRRMLELRARAYALRSAYADALAGFQQREEVEDFQDVTASATVHATIPEPTEAKARTITQEQKAPAAVDTGSSPTGPAAGDGAKQEELFDQPPVQDVVVELTAEQLHAALTKLWKLKPGGKEAAQAINAELKVNSLAADVPSWDQPKRRAYLDALNKRIGELTKDGAK
jgi:hypothetical protein